MALIIETGAGLPDSNSYVSVEELVRYAADRNQELPVDGQEALLFDAMDYLEKFTDNPAYKGVRNSATQALLWPRTGVYIQQFLLPKDQIPIQLKKAQMQLAIEAISFDLMPSSDGYAVAKEKVDVLEVEYATGGRLSGATLPNQPTFPKVDALLSDLLVKIGMRLRGVRI